MRLLGCKRLGSVGHNPNIQQQGVALCIVGCSDLPPRPLTHYLPHHSSHHCFPSLHHHYSPSYAPWYALSFFPSKKSIKGNPFLHYQVFHQKNPSKEIHHLHYQKIPSKETIHQSIICTIKKIHHIIIILFHQFFSSPLRGIFNGR